METYRYIREVSAAWLITMLLWIGVSTHAAEAARTAVEPENVTVLLQHIESFIVDGERIETSDTQLREVIFADGTTLTLGRNTVLIVDSYEYTSSNQSGSMAIRIEQGMVKIAGGLMNNVRPILIQTPGTQLALDDASAVVAVDEDGRTRAYLLLGRGLTMSSGGEEKTLVRAGYQLVSSSTDALPIGPSRIDAETLQADVLSLNPGGTFAGVGSAKEKTQMVKELFARATEDRPNATLPFDGDRSTPTPPPGRPDPINGALDGSDGFGPGVALDGPDIETEQPSQANGDLRMLAQNRDNAFVENGVFTENSRDKGKTTNRLYNSRIPFTQVLLDEGNTNNENKGPLVVGDSDVDPPDQDLHYVFFNDSGGLSLGLDRVGALDDGSSHILSGLFSTFDPSAPFLLRGIALPQDGSVFEKDIDSITNRDVTEDFLDDGEGSIFKEATHFKILQAGFSLQEKMDPADNPVDVVDRNMDNFLLVEVRPGKDIKIVRDDLKEQFSINELGAVNDPVVFNREIGTPLSEFQLSSNNANEISNLNMIAQIVLGDSNLEDATPLDRSELQAIAFLSTVDVDNILLTVNRGVDFELDLNRTERFLFAAGDVDGRLDTNFEKSFSVDRFFISAGIENFNQKDQGRTVANGIRAFARQETGLDLDLTDTGLLVINNGSTSSDAQDALLHADFGLDTSGTHQQSTISITLGQVEYRNEICNDCVTSLSVDTIVSGQTIGSSHGTIVNENEGGTQTTVNEATLSFSSPIANTAAGGGNPALKDEGGAMRKGYAGYLVLENYEPDQQASGASTMVGGLERPLGGSENTQQYAYLRLATATGSSTSGEVQVGQRSALFLNGWSAGLAEIERDDDIGVIQIDTDLSPDNLTLQTNPDTHRVEAKMTFFDHPEIQLGGLGGDAAKGASAFVDDDRFAARTVPGEGAEVAMITGDMLKDGLPSSMQQPIREYKHLKWGFFLGDTIATPGQRQHVHMGSWVAGKVPNPADLPRTGTATYTGHAMGNVFNNGRLYTAVGSVENRWNFGTRTSTMQMQFDGTTLNGSTRLRDNSAVFDGRLDAANRVAGVHGNFVQGGIDPAAGVVGRFSIQESAGAPYRASGTFAAEK